MSLNTETSAALVFLFLYAIVFAFMLFGYSTGRLILRSRFTIILFHVSIRLASQGTAVAFGIIGFANPHLLVAYFVLGGECFSGHLHAFYFLFADFSFPAEGYFTLVLCTYYCVTAWQYRNLPGHNSWLEPRRPPGIPWYKKLLESFSPVVDGRLHPMSIIHLLLLNANAVSD